MFQGGLAVFYLDLVGKCVSSALTTQRLLSVLHASPLRRIRAGTTVLNNTPCLPQKHTYTHTPSKPRAKAFHKFKNGSSIWHELSENRKGQLSPVEVASLEHSITTLLQQLTPTTLSLPDLSLLKGFCVNKCLASEAHFPAAQCLKPSKTLHVYTEALLRL